MEGIYKGRVEGTKPPSLPAGHPSSDAAQDTVNILSCKCTLLAHVQLFVHQDPHVLLHRAAPGEFSQSELISGVALTQV